MKWNNSLVFMRIAGHNYTRVRNLNVQGAGTFPGLIRLTRGSTDPSLGANDGDYLYNLNGNLVYEAAGVTTTLGAVGGVGTTWESLYSNDAAWALTGAFTITQSSNNAFTLTKSATGAGTAFVLNNAGTGDDFGIATTRATSTGIILDFHHDSSTPADADVILEIQVNGEDDASTKTEYGRIRFLSDDVTDATEDATFQLALFVAGTQSTCLAITGPIVTVGDGVSNAIIQSSGALDLILRTNAGTDSGTIRIYDAANGNIEILPNGTGDLTVPTSGIVLGGTTPTRCSFAVAGTTGDGFLITTSTITSGDVLAVDHTVSGTLSGGNLLNLLVDSSSVFAVGETGATTIAGSGGNTVFTITAGDVVLSDASVAITDADNAASFSLTNNTATTASVVVLAGSGAFTGSTTTSFMTLTPSGLTTGTALYIACAAATTASVAVDVTTSTTTGSALRLTTSGVQTDAAATGVLTMVADSATTAGATAGRGLVSLSCDALTTGRGVTIQSTSLGLTSGELLNIDHTASGTITAAKTGQLVDITASRTHNAATAISDDYDALSIIRTNVNVDAGGTLNAAGACLYIEDIATETAGTLADTVNGIEVVMTGTGEAAGYGLSITHTGTTVGRAISVAASQTTGTVALIAGNSLTTTGVGLSITNTGTGMTSGSVLRVASGTTSAVATNGIVSLFATGAFTSTAVTDGFVRVNANSTLSGTAVAVNGNSFTTGVGVYVGDTGTGMTSGSLIRAVSGSTGAVATNGILSVQATGAYTSTANMGILAAIANTTTAGTVAYVSATSMVGGTLLFLNATAATLTGKYIQCYDGAADDFSVGQYGATIIAGNAGSTVLTVTAGDLSFADGSLVLADNDNAISVGITNDTASTIGAAANTGVVDISGDGLTTGTLLNLSVTDGTLTTGRYIKGWDVTRGAEDFGILEDGVAYFAEGIGTVAGGTHVMSFGTSQVIDLVFGSGAPTIAASQGSLYFRTDGSSTSTRMYINTDGAATWTAVTTAA